MNLREDLAALDGSLPRTDIDGGDRFLLQPLGNVLQLSLTFGRQPDI